ncbi:MAG: FG-GAP-like repeat-containing protein [Bacteroidia bacterium]
MKIIFSLIFSLSVIISSTQISFYKSTILDNISTEVGFAIAFCDINNDGRDDLIRVEQEGKLRIFYQTDLTTMLQDSIYYDVSTETYSNWSIAVADIDKNGLRDIFIGGFKKSVILYQTLLGVFSAPEVTAPFFAQGANFIDINNDSWVDLFVCNDDGANFSYRNDTGVLSEDNTLISTAPYAGNYGSVWSDFDGDLDMDLYISKCRAGVTDPTDPRRINGLYRNDGGTFTEMAASVGLDDGAQSWSADFGDIDNDGDMDFLLVNHYDSNRLFENLGGGVFQNISATCGLDMATTIYDFQSIFVDLDNDGFLDIVTANDNNQKIIYQNNGDKTFTPLTSLIDDCWSLSIGDINHDGFLDIYSSYAFGSGFDEALYINNTNTNNYVVFGLKGLQSNTDAIGSILKLYGNWGVQTREVRAGESYGIQTTFNKHFGLGTETKIDSLVVHFPSGKKCVIENINPNLFYELDEDCNFNIWTPPLSNIENNTALLKKINVYPNPVKDFLIIESSHLKGEISVSIFNSFGQEVKKVRTRKKSSTLSLALDSLNEGFYIVSIRDDDGEVYRNKIEIRR